MNDEALIKTISTLKPGESLTLRQKFESLDDAIRYIEKNMELADEPLREDFRRGIEKLRRGRKPKPASQLRRNKTILRFTDAEFAKVRASIDPERELAEAVRELALEAAEARNRTREANGETSGAIPAASTNGETAE